MVDELRTHFDTDITMSNLKNVIVTQKEFFLNEVSEQQVIVSMDIIGEFEGRIYLSVDLRDASELVAY